MTISSGVYSNSPHLYKYKTYQSSTPPTSTGDNHHLQYPTTTRTTTSTTNNHFSQPAPPLPEKDYQEDIEYTTVRKSTRNHHTANNSHRNNGAHNNNNNNNNSGSSGQSSPHSSSVGADSAHQFAQQHQNGGGEESSNNGTIIIRKRLAPRQQRWTSCMLITASILILSVILLVTALLLFFTLSPAALSDLNISGGDQGPYSDKVFSHPAELHSDTVSSKYVLTAVRAGKPKLCLLDASFATSDSGADFRAKHIPSSMHFDIRRITSPSADHPFNLAHPVKFQAYARSLGISDSCHIIVYDHGEEVGSISSATYIWWLFKLYGHKRVSILEGGLKGWKAEGYEVVSGRPIAEEMGDYSSAWDPHWLVTLRDFSNQTLLVDARSESMFEGRARHRLANRAGHIYGAKNVPMAELLTKEGVLKPRGELLKVFGDAGITKESTQVVYSNTGISASAVVYALKTVGIDARLYNGGWIEWSNSRFVQ